jgi:hypothetical protein
MYWRRSSDLKRKPGLLRPGFFVLRLWARFALFALTRPPPAHARAAWAALSPSRRAPSHRSTAARLSDSEPEGEASEGCDATADPLIICRGRPNTCMGFSFASSLSNPSFGEPRNYRNRPICHEPGQLAALNLSSR